MSDDNDEFRIAELLAPLPDGEGGAGIDLREDYSASSLYQQLRDARSAARADERSRDAEPDGSEGETRGWREVLKLAQQALTTRSKDMEIAAWMTEALVRTHGLSGLAAGARILAGICDQYWDHGFPRPDEDGLEVRSLPIGGLPGSGVDGTIMQPLRRITLFRRADGNNLSFYQWEQSEQALTLDEARRAARYESGTPELSALESEARHDRPFLIAVGKHTQAAIEAWAALDHVLEQRFGADAPSLRNVSALLDRILAIIGRLGGIPVAEVADDASAAAGDAGSGPAALAGGAIGTGGALTRESALRELDRIADFFRHTEPHSPLAYTLEEAVRRGKMSLPELLAEVLPDEEVRNGMLQRLGIRPAAGS